MDDGQRAGRSGQDPVERVEGGAGLDAAVPGGGVVAGEVDALAAAIAPGGEEHVPGAERPGAAAEVQAGAGVGVLHADLTGVSVEGAALLGAGPVARRCPDDHLGRLVGGRVDDRSVPGGGDGVTVLDRWRSAHPDPKTLLVAEREEGAGPLGCRPLPLRSQRRARPPMMPKTQPTAPVLMKVQTRRPPSTQ